MIGRRIKRIQIDVAIFMQYGPLTGQMLPHLTFTKWPDDLRFVAMMVEPMMPSILTIYVESDEFPVVEEYQVPPTEPILITQFMCPWQIEKEFPDASKNSS